MEAAVTMALENEAVTETAFKQVAETRDVEKEMVCKDDTIVSDVEMFDIESDELISTSSNAKSDYAKVDVRGMREKKDKKRNCR